MEEKKIYTEEEIEQLAEKASQNAMEHFKHGLNCGECVLQGFLDLSISEYPPEIIALVSGMGGGMGFTKHTCGAVNAGMVVIGSKQGRKNPYAGIYPRHAVYVKDVIKEYGTIECRDLCFPFDESTKEGMKERARNCKKIIGFCAKEATKAALKK